MRPSIKSIDPTAAETGRRHSKPTPEVDDRIILARIGLHIVTEIAQLDRPHLPQEARACVQDLPLRARGGPFLDSEKTQKAL